MQMSPHSRRIRKLIAGGLAPYLAIAMLLWGFEVALFVVAAQAYFPEVDLNSWACIALTAPLLLAALLVNFAVGTALFVRAFVWKKGRDRALRYLFHAREAGQCGMLARMLLLAAGPEKSRAVIARP
jgi:hypothetical protein